MDKRIAQAVMITAAVLLFGAATAQAASMEQIVFYVH